MQSLKKAFSIAALALGGAGTTIGGLGLATGGFSTANQIGGVDLTSLGVAFTLASAAIFYAGYRGIRNSVAGPRP